MSRGCHDGTHLCLIDPSAARPDPQARAGSISLQSLTASLPLDANRAGTLGMASDKNGVEWAGSGRYEARRAQQPCRPGLDHGLDFGSPTCASNSGSQWWTMKFGDVLFKGVVVRRSTGRRQKARIVGASWRLTGWARMTLASFTTTPPAVRLDCVSDAL